MLQTRISSPSPAQSQGTDSASLEQTVSSAIGLVTRQYPVMIITVLVCLSLAGTYLLGATKRYTGTAVLMIDSRKMQGLQTQTAVGGDNPIDSAMVDSQVEVLKSETIASAVIRDLRLLDSPEFMHEEAGLLSGLSQLLSSLFPEERPSDDGLMRAAVGRIQSGLTIKRVGLSYVIEIAYQSTSQSCPHGSPTPLQRITLQILLNRNIRLRAVRRSGCKTGSKNSALKLLQRNARWSITRQKTTSLTQADVC